MRADLQAQLKAKTDDLTRKLNNVGRPYPLGHAFIWGNVPVTLKNGKVKYYLTCITSVCTDDLDGCLRVCRENGVENPWYNLD